MECTLNDVGTLPVLCINVNSDEIFIQGIDTCLDMKLHGSLENSRELQSVAIITWACFVNYSSWALGNPESVLITERGLNVLLQ